MNLRPTGVVSLLVLFLFGLLVSPAGAFPTVPPPEPEGVQSVPLGDMSPRAFLRALREFVPAVTRQANFDELTIERDAGRLSFVDGWVTLVEIGGIVVGATILGQGTFEMTPPDPVEQWQMERFFDNPTATVELKSAYLLFTDSTLEELSRTLEFHDGPPTPYFREVLEEGSKYLTHTSQVGVEAVRTFLNGEGSGFFHVHLAARRGDPYFFRISSFNAEEVSFGRRADVRGDHYETLSAFHLAEEYPFPDPTQAGLEGPRFLHYQIEAWISRGPDLAAEATGYLSTELEEGNWVNLYLSSDLELDSLRWDDGSEASFERSGRDSWIWLALPPDPGFRQLTAWYHGRVLEYQDLFYWFEDPTGWYPRLSETDATFDMTFHVDKRYQFLASGNRVEYVEGEDEVTSRWVVETPESQVSFNLGEFTEHFFEFPGIPPVRLHVNEEFHSRLYSLPILLQEKNVADAVSADLASSLSFFQNVYGPLDVQEFNASEVPYAHGQAFPGLIHLSVLTFLQSGVDDDGENEAFRAHEVSHQWWAFSVEPRSYRDQWLSEGLAQFSGLWYMQVARSNPEKYLKALDESRDRIFRRRGKAGPISLGTRVAIGNKDEDYQTIIYDKGAWVIHMLRNLFLDLDTLDETPFKNLMRDVAQRFKNRQITTQEFQAVVEEHLGNVDMQWFFDQWVHGTDLPTYRWASQGEEVEGGYKLTIRVRQEDVPEDFQMLVPVTVQFWGEGAATVRILVKGKETVVELPLMPRKPDEILFNDFESVLARVRDEGW